MDDLDRFLAKVEFAGGCWYWTASRDSRGYGFFRVAGKSVLAHRWSYEHHVGPIPAGLQLDHLCRTPRCVNPSHLDPVTAQENIRRGTTGQARGEQQRAKTHCPHGHPYDAANTLPQRGGTGRRCRACKNADERARAQRRRTKV